MYVSAVVFFNLLKLFYLLLLYTLTHIDRGKWKKMTKKLIMKIMETRMMRNLNEKLKKKIHL